jgi:hypothetical protein
MKFGTGKWWKDKDGHEDEDKDKDKDRICDCHCRQHSSKFNITQPEKNDSNDVRL